MINIGSMVSVIDTGKYYSSYEDWVNIHAKQYKHQWESAGNFDDSLKYTVVASGKHHLSDKMLYLIQGNNHVYIMGEQGIKEESEEETMEFKVGDDVKVVKVHGGGWKAESLGLIGVITKLDNDCRPYRVDFKDLNDWWWFAEDELELAVKPVEFKVGDEVKVIDDEGDYSATIGDIATVIHVEPAANPKDGQMVIVETKDGKEYDMFSRRYLKMPPTPMSYKDALLHTINGTMTVRHTSMNPGEYLIFNDGFKGSKGWCGAVVACQEHTGNWEQYIVPTPPKFTIDELVYNADGTIGKVVEDKGLFKGIRKYAVRFNAVREAVKNCDESELSAYVL